MSWIDKVFINNLRCLLFPKYFAAYIYDGVNFHLIELCRYVY